MIFTARCSHGCVGGLTKNIEIFMKNSGTKKVYRRIEEDKVNLKAFLNCQALGVKERMGIKQILNDIDDATLGTSTKVKHSQEIYREMKAHKQYAEDSDKTRKILVETQTIITEAMQTEITLPTIEKVKVSELLLNEHVYESTDEKKGWLALFYELEGTYLC